MATLAQTPVVAVAVVALPQPVVVAALPAEVAVALPAEVAVELLPSVVTLQAEQE